MKLIQALLTESTYSKIKAAFTAAGATYVGAGSEGVVYNAAHLFGFFSVFNPDVIKDVKLYKGGIPARFGGRLSSVLDIYQKEGNSNIVYVYISKRLIGEYRCWNNRCYAK